MKKFLVICIALAFVVGCSGQKKTETQVKTDSVSVVKDTLAKTTVDSTVKDTTK
jgi:uncharacterized lipoprotein YajG